MTKSNLKIGYDVIFIMSPKNVTKPTSQNFPFWAIQSKFQATPVITLEQCRCWSKGNFLVILIWYSF